MLRLAAVIAFASLLGIGIALFMGSTYMVSMDSWADLWIAAGLFGFTIGVPAGMGLTS